MKFESFKSILHNFVAVSKEPLKKKARRVVIESDGDGDEPERATNREEDSTDTEKSETDSDKKSVSKSRKKVIIKSSGDEDDEETAAKTSSKKSKKKKEKKKKHDKKPKRVVEEEAASGDEGEDFGEDDMSGDSDNSDTEEHLTDQQKEAVLALFNDASVEDIQSMMNIAKKRLEALVSLRPFENFNDLVCALSFVLNSLNIINLILIQFLSLYRENVCNRVP